MSTGFKWFAKKPQIYRMALSLVFEFWCDRLFSLPCRIQSLRLDDHSKVSRYCREMQLKIVMFNSVFSKVTYLQKLFCMSVATVGIFLAIICIEAEPLIATFTFSTSSYAALLYTIVYDRWEFLSCTMQMINFLACSNAWITKITITYNFECS